MSIRFLWIEDAAEEDLQALLAPLVVSGRFRPIIAATASDGYRLLQEREFDAVIVDIRIPPGTDTIWRELYMRFGERTSDARLGMHLLDGLFRPENSQIGALVRPTWLLPNCVGVVTVETEADLEYPKQRWGIAHYLRKDAELKVTELKRVLDDITSKDSSR